MPHDHTCPMCLRGFRCYGWMCPGKTGGACEGCWDVVVEEERTYGTTDEGVLWRSWPSIPGKWTFERREDGSWEWKRIDEEEESK
jgi:hypothetical protein